MNAKPIFHLAAICACTLLAASSAHAVIISTVPVGNSGNTSDANTGSHYGSVGYNYNIGTYDVTILQYTAFLNAVALSDPNNLYNPNMATDLNVAGISRSGSSGSYTYSVIGSGQRPVSYVSWYDAARFCNWLTNGQGSSGTETGVYTLTGPTSISGTLPADHSGLTGTGTKWFIPTENEWYKAAYYSASINDYYAYPFRTNTAPTVNDPSALNSNSGNFYNGAYATTQSFAYSTSQNYLTDVGAYVSTSPYGSYDMGGDVFQWNETLIGSFRGIRGGVWFHHSSAQLAAADREFDTPSVEGPDVGFRVANLHVESLPEPGSFTMMLLGAIGLWIRRGRR